MKLQLTDRFSRLFKRGRQTQEVAAAVEIKPEAKPADPDPEAERRQAEGARLKMECLEQELKITKLEAIILAQKKARLDKLNAKPLDKILYLPAGRVKSLPGESPELDLEVDEKMALELNQFLLVFFEKGQEPFLDLMHDRKSRILEIRKFEFEKKGLFAYGHYTELGEYFRDSGRISGVSISTPVARWNNKPVNFAFDVEIPITKEEPGAEKIPATFENMSNMGGVLIDGRMSALQPY